MRKTALLLASTTLAVLLAGGVALVEVAAPAQAAFPGNNGKIAFTSSRDGNQEIYDMNPDATSQRNLTGRLSGGLLLRRQEASLR